MKVTKQVEWAYPSSPNADRFHFARGCWTVQTVTDNQPPVALSGHSSRDEALLVAMALPHPWSWCWLQFNEPPEVAVKRITLPSIMAPEELKD